MSNFKKEPPDKYTIIKTSFKNIQKYNVDYKPLLDAFYRSNETYIHVSYFFLLYQIYSFEKDENMIEVNATNLNLALIALKNESLGANSSFENKIVIDKFKDFYNDTYKNLVDNKKLKCKNLGSINDFSLKQIETTFYTNIKRNFINSVWYIDT